MLTIEAPENLCLALRNQVKGLEFDKNEWRVFKEAVQTHLALPEKAHQAEIEYYRQSWPGNGLWWHKALLIEG